MGKLFLRYLDAPSVYRCKTCRAHLADRSEIFSKAFQGRTGKAYLFNWVVNVTVGSAEERNLITGKHIVADIMCKGCSETIGWTYLRAYDESQKYKEGKVIVEVAFMAKERNPEFDAG